MATQSKQTRPRAAPSQDELKIDSISLALPERETALQKIQKYALPTAKTFYVCMMLMLFVLATRCTYNVYTLPQIEYPSDPHPTPYIKNLSQAQDAYISIRNSLDQFTYPFQTLQPEEKVLVTRAWYKWIRDHPDNYAEHPDLYAEENATKFAYYMFSPEGQAANKILHQKYLLEEEARKKAWDDWFAPSRNFLWALFLYAVFFYVLPPGLQDLLLEFSRRKKIDIAPPTTLGHSTYARKTSSKISGTEF